MKNAQGNPVFHDLSEPSYVQFEAHLPVLVEPPVQRTNFMAKLGKVKRTLLFALLLNDEDGNCLIDQAWNPFWRVALVPLRK